MRSVTVFLLALVACSASEGANHGIRCDVDAPCPDQLVCYRNFCIPGDVPREDLDASGVTGEVPTTGDAAQSADTGTDASGVVIIPEGIDADTEDAAAPGADDAQTPINPDDASTDGTGTGEPPTPVVDSGAPVVDAGRANSAALLVCLPSCSSRSFVCLVCLRNVLQENPEVCSEAQASSEPLVSQLCDYLCTNAACQARP